jgi:fructose-1,6-bisphosphatase III
MLLWYLWCGRKSPLFCKDKMATVERSIFNEEVAKDNPVTTWTEVANPFYKHNRNDDFLRKILKDFHASRICMGHTPVKSAEQGILGTNLNAFIIDGGASDAYGDKGVTLISTPEFTFLTEHPPLDDLIKAEEEDRLPKIKVTPLEDKTHTKLRHTDKGFFLKQELAAISELLDSKLDTFCDKYFYE